jgi:hypothetical protein
LHDQLTFVLENGKFTGETVVVGHSSGAQLAALMCTDEKYVKAEGFSLTAIKGCMPVDADTFDIFREDVDYEKAFGAAANHVTFAAGKQRRTHEEQRGHKQPAVPAGFADEAVASVGSPTALAFTPDGRLLINSQPGSLRVYQAGALLPVPARGLIASAGTDALETGAEVGHQPVHMGAVQDELRRRRIDV